MGGTLTPPGCLISPSGARRPTRFHRAPGVANDSPDAYDGAMRKASSGGLPGPLRWSLWLTAGVVAGLVVGFVLGLTRPRARLT